MYIQLYSYSYRTTPTFNWTTIHVPVYRHRSTIHLLVCRFDLRVKDHNGEHAQGAWCSFGLIEIPNCIISVCSSNFRWVHAII